MLSIALLLFEFSWREEPFLVEGRDDVEEEAKLGLLLCRIDATLVLLSVLGATCIERLFETVASGM